MSDNLKLLIDLYCQRNRLPSNVEYEIFQTNNNNLIHYYLDTFGVKKERCIAYRIRHYAMYVIKNRWLEAECVITKNAEQAYRYAKNVIKGRFIEAEPIIAKDAEWAYWYAKDVIKGRFIEAEQVIAKNTEWAYYYLLDIVKGRWPEVEHILVKDGDLALYYATNVMKGRWLEAEPIIATKQYYVRVYSNKFGIFPIYLKWLKNVIYKYLLISKT